MIRLDAAARRLDLLVEDAELAARRSAAATADVPPGAQAARGYRLLYLKEVLQADGGCDFASFVPEATAIAPLLDSAESRASLQDITTRSCRNRVS